MKETGMLFTSPKVRAILEGCKTQTPAAVAVPEGWALVPLEATQEMIDAWGNATELPEGMAERSDDEVNAYAAQRDWKAMLAVAPKPPEVAPVELPKPVGWFHRHSKECKNGEVCSYRIAPADKKDGWEEFPLYTEQQVRALLAEVSAPAAQAQRVPLSEEQRRAIFDDLWPHGADAGIRKLFTATVFATEAAHGITKEKP